MPATEETYFATAWICAAVSFPLKAGMTAPPFVTCFATIASVSFDPSWSRFGPTVLETTMQDATHATWSGTLTPSDWDGGCQNALYRIEYAFGPDGDSGVTDWFRCSGPAG